MRKVVLIQGLIAPYRYPVFEEIAKNKDYDFEVWFMGSSVKNRKWAKNSLDKFKFKYRFLKGITLNFGIKDNYPFWINTSIIKELHQDKPDYVIMIGWDSITSFLAHIYCLLFGVKFILYSESTIHEKSLRRTSTLQIVKLHARLSNKMIAGGTRAKEYLESLGVSKDKILIAFNSVDNNYYKSSKVAHNGIVIICYAQLIYRKGQDILIKAFSKLQGKHKDISLLIVGDGKYKEELVSLADSLKVKNIDFIDDPGDEVVRKLYGAADIFVLPSREDVWGLVVNQALAASLPVVVSDKAGSSVDLISEGYNGFTFKSGSVSSLESKLDKLLTNQSLLLKMASNAVESIQRFSPKDTAKSILETIKPISKNEHNEVKFEKPVKKSFVSVIIPEFDDKKGLEKTFESLNKQNFDKSKYEIIVEHDKLGLGSYITRNKAILKSSGEFIAFIDAGTEASIDWLSRGFQDLQKFDYVGGRIEINSHSAVSLREFAVSEFMYNQHFSPTTNLFVKRQVIENIGGFDKRLVSSGDYEFGDRVYMSGKFSQYYDNDLIVYHPSRNFKEMIKKQKRLAKGFYDLSKFYPERFGKFKLNPLKIFIPPIWLFWNSGFKKLNINNKIKLFLTSYWISIVQHFYFTQYVYSRGH